MMRHVFYGMSIFIVGCLFNSYVYALAPSEQFSGVQLRNLTSDEQNYLSNTTNDGHIILDNVNLTREKMCGVALTIEFKQAPLRASLFDVYWRTADVGFTESQKGSFVINQKDAANRHRYLLPLCKLYGFSGNLNKPLSQANISAFRLDYPPNKNISLRIESIEFLDNQLMVKVEEQDADIVTLELYERIPAQSFTSLDVIVPKLIFAFEEGIKRLGSDLPFLVFWLGLILLLKLLLLKSFMRQFSSKDD